jgi:S1-C subfamily serine protease
VDDERARYHLARLLASFADDFLQLKSRLERGEGPVLSGMIRQDAEQAVALLAEHGIAAQIEPEDVPTAPLEATRAGRQRWWFAAAGAALLILAVLIVSVLVEHANERPRPLSPAEIGHRYEHAAVHLKGKDRLGAGFFFASDLVLTNAHVVAEEELIEVVTQDGTKRRGKVLGRDERIDLAVIEVRGLQVAPLPLGDATALQRGDSVYTMGSPFGLDFTLSQGIVSHPDRVILGLSTIQINASIHPGNSGGALLDAFGHAVGVVTMQIRDRSDLGFAVPVNYLYGSGLPGDRPDPWFAAARWRGRLNAAAREERAEVAQLRQEIGRPFLAGASLAPPGMVVAVVLRAADSQPAPEAFAFVVRSGNEDMCQPSGQVERWIPWSDGSQSDQTRWLARHGIAPEFWAGTAHLRMTGCPSPNRLVGTTLMLEGGATSAQRAVIEAESFRQGG